MKLAREPFLAGAVLLLVCIANGISRWQDPSVSRTELHADAPHFERTDMAVRALDRGENPFAGWLARRSSSYPALLVYQPLAHGVVVALHFVFPRGLLLLDLFVWVRFLAVALLPLSFFLASRLLRLGLPAAIIGALLAALIQAGSLAGDVFPQAVATHFLLLALGLAFRAVRGGRMLVLTAAVLGLTVLAHLLYGYLGALSLLLLAWMPDAEVPRAVRIQRAGQIGLLALPVAGLHLVPLVLDSAAIVWRPWDTRF
ncbi:MAG: hypothetical protein NTY38_05020 [Acidobacteria bacterium]|nr:hypothetical protein [Acidobacteriota bacterium]